MIRTRARLAVVIWLIAIVPGIGLLVLSALKLFDTGHEPYPLFCVLPHHDCYECPDCPWFSPYEWRFGRLCDDPADPARCLLRGFGEGDEAAANYAELGLSRLGSSWMGSSESAAHFIELSASAGSSPRTAFAARVYDLLFGNAPEPVVDVARYGPYGQVIREDATMQAWSIAASRLERAGLASPETAFLWAYVHYRWAATGEPCRTSFHHRERAAETLDRLVAEAPAFVDAHPEVYYVLARCRFANYHRGRGVRAMRAYVERLEARG